MFGRNHVCADGLLSFALIIPPQAPPSVEQTAAAGMLEVGDLILAIGNTRVQTVEQVILEPLNYYYVCVVFLTVGAGLGAFAWGQCLCD